MTRRFVFLDRDGVINEHVGYLTDFRKQWHWCDGAAEALYLLHKSPYQPVIVTNQSAVSRGMMTAQKLYDIHTEAAQHLAWTRREDCWPPTFVCPHGPGDECGCRKPLTGMYTQVLWRFPGGIHEHSWMVGDSASDREFANRVGLNYAHIPDDYPRLLDFVRQLLKEQLDGEAEEAAENELCSSRRDAERAADPL